MKLAMSSIAWSPPQHDEVASILRTHGFGGVEYAPTSIWGDWDDIFSADHLTPPPPFAGLAPVAFQAIVYGRPDHILFQDPDARARLAAHLRRVIDVAQALGVPVLVFGSPRNRLRGDMPLETAIDVASGFFTEVGTHAHERGVKLCIEANPPGYGCDFLTTTGEVVAFVDRLACPGLGIHLDTGGARMVGEDLPALIHRHGDRIDHVHASEPNLGDFAAPAADHDGVAQALRDVCYSNWVSIEMRAPATGIDGVLQAVEYVSRVYGD